MRSHVYLQKGKDFEAAEGSHTIMACHPARIDFSAGLPVCPFTVQSNDMKAPFPGVGRC
jgi:hypothetical protein